MRKVVNDLKLLLGEENVREDFNIKNYLSFKIDCKAKLLVEIYNKSQLIKILDYLSLNKLKYVVIGGGSNIIFKKSALKGIVIHLNDGYSKIYFKNGHFFLSAFCGCKIGSIIKKCKENGFSCLEWAVGIPASIGGAVIMNMGAFENCVADKVESVTYYENGKVFKIKNNAKNLFSYRNSVFKTKKCVIIGVTVKLARRAKDMLQADILQYLKKKSAMQPLNFASCGSVFKNGDNYFSAKLIQDCGLKGSTIGGAQVSIKHSNFIINYNGDATFSDVIKLIDYVKKQVYKKYKINLVEEVEIL